MLRRLCKEFNGGTRASTPAKWTLHQAGMRTWTSAYRGLCSSQRTSPIGGTRASTPANGRCTKPQCGRGRPRTVGSAQASGLRPSGYAGVHARKWTLHQAGMRTWTSAYRGLCSSQRASPIGGTRGVHAAKWTLHQAGMRTWTSAYLTPDLEMPFPSTTRAPLGPSQQCGDRHPPPSASCS